MATVTQTSTYIQKTITKTRHIIQTENEHVTQPKTNMEYNLKADTNHMLPMRL